VLLKEKEAYSSWLLAYRNLPRVERFGLGRRIEESFLDLLEATFVSCYLPPEQKVIGLHKAITKLDVVKFFLQLLWETNLITTQKYSELSDKFEQIGRQLGGWKNGLLEKLNKTPRP
jgi:hypothetical protein